MSCRNCTCDDCRRSRELQRQRELAATRPTSTERGRDENCVRCGGLVGGNWTNNGCICHHRRDDNGYGSNHF